MEGDFFFEIVKSDYIIDSRFFGRGGCSVIGESGCFGDFGDGFFYCVFYFCCGCFVGCSGFFGSGGFFGGRFRGRRGSFVFVEFDGYF